MHRAYKIECCPCACNSSNIVRESSGIALDVAARYGRELHGDVGLTAANEDFSSAASLGRAHRIAIPVVIDSVPRHHDFASLVPSR